MSKVSYKVQGVKGGTPQFKENVGYVATFVDDLTITADAFEGFGEDYKRRKKSLVQIFTHEGVMLFSGTSTELVEKLQK